MECVKVKHRTIRVDEVLEERRQVEKEFARSYTPRPIKTELQLKSFRQSVPSLTLPDERLDNSFFFY